MSLLRGSPGGLCGGLPSRLAFIDVESTGAHPVRDRITEIAILLVEDGGLV